MADFYTSVINSTASRNRPAVGDRLSPRAAALAVFAVSLVFWAPILLPILAIFHR